MFIVVELNETFVQNVPTNLLPNSNATRNMNQIECDYDDEAVMTRLLPMSHRRMMEMDGGRSAPGVRIIENLSTLLVEHGEAK